jgi:hypothetical protein
MSADLQAVHLRSRHENSASLSMTAFVALMSERGPCIA